MDNKIISILKKVYFHGNGFYNSEFDRHEHKIPDSVNQIDLGLLTSKGFEPNDFETYEHDTSLSRLLAYRDDPKLSLEFARSNFLKGLTGEFPRGRQTLMSYMYIKHLSHHEFEGEKTCAICGLPRKETIDKTNQLYTYYLGHSWNEVPIHFLIELQEVISHDKPDITEEDKNKLVELLNFIAACDLNETPGKLEKRIAKHKILPKTDKYKRYGILQTLSECGILPNDFIKPKFEKFYTQRELWEASNHLNTSHRSDIILPLGGWKGKNGVDYERYKEIFE